MKHFVFRIYMAARAFVKVWRNLSGIKPRSGDTLTINYTADFTSRKGDEMSNSLQLKRAHDILAIENKSLRAQLAASVLLSTSLDNELSVKNVELAAANKCIAELERKLAEQQELLYVANKRILETEKQEKQEPVPVEIRMGFGNVAVGAARHPVDCVPGLIYLPIYGGARNHDEDCGDIYPPGSQQTEYLTVVYFYTPEVLQQTIDVLLEIQRVNVFTGDHYD